MHRPAGARSALKPRCRGQTQMSHEKQGKDPKSNVIPIRSAPAATSTRRAHHVVPVDEARTRVGEIPIELSVQTADGVDELGEELGETFVANVTGADDAAMEDLAEDAAEEAQSREVVPRRK